MAMTPIRHGAARRNGVGALGLGLAMLGNGGALAQGNPAGILAAQLRDQGYACTTPSTATRDHDLSTPDQAVWTLDCGNAKYRLHLIPNGAARVVVLGG